MYPNQASYKEIHPGLIGTTKKLCYSQTRKLESPDLRFIQLPGDSPPLYVSKSSFLQSDSSWFDWNDEEAVLFPNRETESPDLKVDNFFMPTPMRFIQLPGDSPPLYWDNFFMPTPMRFIQLPGDSPPLYVSKSSFYKVIHPGLIGTTKKLCYSQTGKLESPDLKVG
ncbi:hypothetical protein Bca4012_102808 [Brassica carinata]